MSGLRFATLLVIASMSGGASAGMDPKSSDRLGRYFSSGWTKADPASAVPPPPAKGSPEPEKDKPVEDKHSPPAHMFITSMAFKLYVSQYGGGELSKYIGDSADSEPASDKEDNVVEGAYEEDKPYRNPWNQMIPEMRHFWDSREGPFKGFGDYDSSVNRAQKYFTGGFGLDGDYDKGWSENSGQRRGTQGQGIVYLYNHGEKGKAYWYLGHAAHLLEDLTVPAHNLLWPHPLPGSDAYESYMKDHHREWDRVPEGRVESFDTLYDLFLQTGEVADGFDAGWGPGPWGGKDGERDIGFRREEHFQEEDLREEGDVLMPLAYRRVAALFLYFFKQVDKTPPRVTLVYPRSANEASPDRALGPLVTLRARAVDDISGVDRRGYRFEYSAKSGKSWSAWKSVLPTPASSEVEFTAEPGRSYAFRVTAADAAGNRGVSAVRYLTAGPVGPAVASAR